MPGIPLEYNYPLFTLFVLVLTVIFVPKQKYGSLFWSGFFWGFFLSVVVACVSGTFFGLYHYVKDEPFTFLGSPLLLNVAWLGAIMIYLRFLPTRKVWYVFPVYLFVFSFASMILDMVFHQIGMLAYTGWNPIYRFLLALGWFYLTARHQWILDEMEIKLNADEKR